MNDLFVIGKSVPRKEAKDKVTGAAKYTNDYSSPGMLHARLVTSTFAHVKIKKIDISIPFDFEYYKPDSKEEAVKLFEELSTQGKQPIYYSGGTEIITGARRNLVFTKAIIDIKGIPECNVFELSGNELIIGGPVTLTQVSATKGFPFLSKNSSFPANHTARNKITLCGNICGKIPYREAILSHLVADSKVVVMGTKGVKALPIN